MFISLQNAKRAFNLECMLKHNLKSQEKIEQITTHHLGWDYHLFKFSINPRP